MCISSSLKFTLPTLLEWPPADTRAHCLCNANIFVTGISSRVICFEFQMGGFYLLTYTFFPATFYSSNCDAFVRYEKCNRTSGRAPNVFLTLIRLKNLRCVAATNYTIITRLNRLIFMFLDEFCSNSDNYAAL